MISSRAFSCWTEHESLGLHFQRGVPFGTLLATRLASLSKQMTKLRASFLTIKTGVSSSVCEGLRLAEDVQRVVVTATMGYLFNPCKSAVYVNHILLTTQVS